MITVQVLINGQVIACRSARNYGEKSNGFTRYVVDDGNEILHKREDGAISLAIDLLTLIKEI